MEPEIINEVFINNNMIQMDKDYDICKATIKIVINSSKFGSGCFLKFKRNGKSFYCILTNQHVIEPCLVNNKDEITVRYDNEKKDFTIKLDKKERIIECFKDNDALKIDATLIEIIEKDNIDDSYFLFPNMDYIDNKKLLINQDIVVSQYPKGKILSISTGKITRISPENDFIFYHNADTTNGSSGGPIVLKGEKSIFAIHAAGVKGKAENVGMIIEIIVNMMSTYKKNGERIEYYKNGKIKYEGNFLDDEYNGEGIFFDENGDIYIGQFKKGKKNGNFAIKRSDDTIKECEFENDELINNENSDIEDNNENDDKEKMDNIKEENKNEDDYNKSHENSENNDNEKSDNINDENKKENDSNKSHEDNEHDDSEKSEDINEENKNEDDSNKSNENTEHSDENHEEDDQVDNYENNQDNENENNNNNNNNSINIINNNTINNINNNYNIINNNINNNNQGLNNNLVKDIEINAFHILHGLGNMIGVRCTRCGHPSKSHFDKGYGQWKCNDCQPNNNICKVN